MSYILGVDGGGTKTLSKVVDMATGKSAEYETGSSDYKSVGISSAKKNITDSVVNAINNLNKDINIIASACFGLSGYDCGFDYNIYQEIVFNGELRSILNEENTAICNDTKIGLFAGTEKRNAVIIVCGTGSNCYGINENGIESRANGWDYIMGDEGSGYSISVKALRMLMKSYDGRGSNTILYEKIFEFLKINNIGQLMNWAYNPFSKEKIASLALVVEEAAVQGDAISISILDQEANEAFLSIKAVVHDLKLENKDFDCILAGSIFKCKDHFRSIIINKLQEIYQFVNVKHLNEKPVEGALMLARRNIS